MAKATKTIKNKPPNVGMVERGDDHRSSAGDSLELKKHIDRSSSILECPEPVRHKQKSDTPDKFQFKSINMTAFSIIIIIELFLEPKNL